MNDRHWSEGLRAGLAVGEGLSERVRRYPLVADVKL